jgi:hypothetical protein
MLTWKGGAREVMLAHGLVLGKFYKHFLSSVYRSTLFGIFLKPDSKQTYLQVEQRQLS